MFTGLTAAYGITLHGLFILLALLTYVVASHAFNQRRHPTAAIAWVLFILLVPYVALPVFLVFGSRKQTRPRLLLPPAEVAADDIPWTVLTIGSLGQPGPATYRDLRIHADGAEALAALWRVIEAARESIDICTFIIGRDAVGMEVIARLVAKARAGVRVRLMVDGMGQLMHRQPALAPLTRAGAQYAVFVPPLKTIMRARSNLRDHRKLVIADAQHDSRRLWCGGRNLACEYFEGVRGGAPWHDLTIDVGGDFVVQAIDLFEHDWAYAHGQKRDPLTRSVKPMTLPPDPFAQLVASGPDEVDDTIYTLLVTSAYRARKRLALITPYFVPDAGLLVALCMAARRGVVVDLLIPERSNHPMSDIARRRALRTLALAGGRIWLAPQMLHAKLAVVDDVLAMVGSANIDSRSLFLNYELMIAFHERLHIERFAAWFEQERQAAARYEPRNPGLFADVAEGLVLWTGFQL